MRARIGILLAGLVLIHPAAAGGRSSAADGFKAIQAAASSADAATVETALPGSLGEGMVGAAEPQIAAWRRDFAAALAAAKVVDVREEGDEAVVALKPAGAEDRREVPLHFDGTRWAVAAPLAYVVGAPSLTKACGRAPAEVVLPARMTSGPYGPSAISFAHVTQDPGQCRNRMDLWYCHNGELHATAEGRIARVPGKRLTDVDGLPLGVVWKKRLVPEAGGVYVIHCRRDNHRDFYVKARAKSVDAKQIEIEWTLLAEGFGSPADIHSAQPLVSNDGADGWDGLCGRSAGRLEPEPPPKRR